MSRIARWAGRRPRHGAGAPGRGPRALLACGTALLVLLLLAVARRAEAHATLLSSEPAAGSTSAASPPRVRLVFSEEIEAPLTRLSLTDGAGRTIRLDGHADPRDVHAVIAPIDETLAPGAYRLTWRIVSADGHAVSGSLVFSVAGPAASGPATPPPATPPAGPRPSAAPGPTILTAPLLPAVLRALGVGALMALGGLLFFLAPAPLAAPPGARRLAGWLALAAPFFLSAHLLAWLVHTSPTQRLDAAWAGTAFGTAVGRVELWRVGLAWLALWALGLARRVRPALLFAGAALVVCGAVGHAAALHPLWAVPAKALHLVAAAAWTGGILWLLALRRADARVFAAEAERVSAVALAAAIAVALSGAVQTALFLASPLDLVRSAYGVTVLAKVAGLAVLVAFGARYRTRVLPALAADPAGRPAFARLLARELAVMGAVVLLAGLLAYLSPSAAAATDRHTPTHSTD